MALPTFLAENPLLYADMIEPIRRGTGVLTHGDASAAAIRVCGCIGMVAADAAHTVAFLEEMGGLPLLTVHGRVQAEAWARLHPEMGRMPCHQAVYFHRAITVPKVTGITLRPLTAANVSWVEAMYGRYHDPEEIAPAIARGEMLGAFAGDMLAGFVGMHEEGGIGMLQVAEDFRRRGIGAMLEAEMVRRELARGHLPFCQITEGNGASLALQRALGMTVTETACVTWFFREEGGE